MGVRLMEKDEAVSPDGQPAVRLMDAGESVTPVTDTPSFGETLRGNATGFFKGGLSLDKLRDGAAQARGVSESISKAEGGVRGAISEGILTPAQMVAAGAAGMPHLLLDRFPAWASEKLFGGDVVPTDYFPSPADVQQFITDQTGLSQNPSESSEGRVGQAAVAGAMASPTMAIIGALSGAGSELAGQATEGTRAEVVARIIGAAAPFGAKAGVNALRRSPADNITRELANLSDDQLESVLDLMENAQELGTPITVAEAVAQVSRPSRAGAGLRGQRK